MKVRKAIKSIVALGTGAAMMGATMFSALGANLEDFPKPMFIGEDGAFDGVFVVGDAPADPADLIGVTNIMGSMQSAAVKKVPIEGGTTTTVVEGDSFLVASGGNNLNFLESLASVQSVVDSSDLAALGTDSFKNNKGTYSYDQYVDLPYATVMYTDQHDGDPQDPGDFLKFNSSKAAWTYRLSFPTAAKTDIDSNNDLDDLDNKKITMLGQEYNFVNTNYVISSGYFYTELELMSGSVTGTLTEGETKTYTIGSVDYEITVDYISADQARFTINSETTDLLAAGETFALEDETEIGVKNILAQNLLGETGGDQVEFYFGATKLYLKDTNSSSSTAAEAASFSTVKVGAETISDAFADIVWNNATSGEIAISEIKIGFYPSDNIYVAEGDTLASEVASERGDADWVKLHEALPLDIHYAGTEYGETEEIKFKPSGSSKLKVELMTKSGDECKQDVLYTDETNIFLRDGNDATKNITFYEGYDVGDEGIFFVERNKYSHIMRLKKIDTSNLEIDLKDECSGATETVSYSGTTATFYKDGQAYGLTGISAGGVKVSDITDDSDGMAHLWTKYEGELDFTINTTDVNRTEPYTGTTQNFTFVFTEGPDINRDETATPTDHINVTVKLSSNKITPSTVSSGSENGDSNSLTNSWDSKDDFSSGRTKWGTLIDHDTSGDQDTVTLTYNEKEAMPQVYLTTGAVETTEGVSGSYSTEVVQIPDSAVKLASEVADALADNMIVVGGPCVNTVAAEIMGVTDPATCAEGFTEGKAMIKLYENDEKVAMLVAGYSATDTRRAALVASNYADYAEFLSGDEVEVTGTSLTDITVGAPTVVEDDTVEDDTVDDETEGDDTEGDGTEDDGTEGDDTE